MRLSRTDARARLEVEDAGPGIPPERLRNLFQPFQSSAPGGFGIGLYESKRIVESYRGTLRVESEPGKGTRVVVELPAIAPGAAGGADFGSEQGERAMKRSSWALVVLATFAVWRLRSAIKGCGVVKDFRKSRHLKAAERYDAEKKYKEATIEYRNALRFDPQDLQTVKKLGLRLLRERADRRRLPAAQALRRTGARTTSRRGRSSARST